jgi:hypothetical protein
VRFHCLWGFFSYTLILAYNIQTESKPRKIHPVASLGIVTQDPDSYQPLSSTIKHKTQAREEVLHATSNTNTLFSSGTR